MQVTSTNSAANANTNSNSNPNPNVGANVNKDSNVSAVPSGVAREFHNFVADIEDLIKSTTNLTGEDLNRAKAKLNQRIAAAKTSIEDMSGTVVERARKTAETTNNYVHEQPWNAVGAGAAIGLVLGYLLARR